MVVGKEQDNFVPGGVGQDTEGIETDEITAFHSSLMVAGWGTNITRL